MVGNLFGTMERMRYLFRDTLDALARLVKLQVDPADLLRRPRLYLDAPGTPGTPGRDRFARGPVLANETTIDQLPQLVSWPDDGGAYVTLPQVYTEDPRPAGLRPVEPGDVSRAAFRRAVSAESRRSGCTTRSNAASAPIMPRRSAGASGCGSTCSSAARRP